MLGTKAGSSAKVARTLTALPSLQCPESSFFLPKGKDENNSGKIYIRTSRLCCRSAEAVVTHAFRC